MDAWLMKNIQHFFVRIITILYIIEIENTNHNLFWSVATLNFFHRLYYTDEIRGAY